MKSLTNNLLLLICCSLLFTVFITSVAIYGDKHSMTQNNMALQAKDITADIMPPPMYLIELRLVLSQLIEGSITLEEGADDITRLKTQWHERVDYWKETLSGELREHLVGEQYRAGIKLINDADELVRKLRQGIPLNNNELATFNQDYNNHLKGIQEFVKSASDYANQAIDASKASSELVFKVILLSAGISIILLLVISIWIHRNIFRSLGAEPAQVADIAIAVASGDLSRTVVVPEGDTSSVMASMKIMCNKLTEIIQTVSTSSNQISTSSDEIANSNLALADRTRQQASALEQTAASMEEMTATVKKNAENSLCASELANKVSSSAEQGGKMVSEVMQTMDGISSSSNKITSIIGVIDSIAFQTNILALNAAVEAARAGTEGRGFAVVAGEVRTLASHCADAAKEIKSLIEESVKLITSGNTQVNEAVKTIAAVVEDVKQVANLIMEITDASNQQSGGIEQVSIAIGQIDAGIQQNGVMVNQATATADSLRSQTEELNAAMSQFKLNSASKHHESLQA